MYRKSARSISQISIFLKYTDFEETFTYRFVQRVRVLTWQPLSASFYFYSIYQLSYWTEHHCTFRILLNSTKRHHFDSQGTYFMLVKSREINRVYVRPLLWFCLKDYNCMGMRLEYFFVCVEEWRNFYQAVIW